MHSAAARKRVRHSDARLNALQKEHDDFYRHNHNGAAEYLGDMVYGALDGIVTTFAVVAGASGAGLNSGVIVVLGFANLFADGLSMAVGNFLSIKSQQSYYEAERLREEKEVERFPDIEREEVRRLYLEKGFSGKKLEQLVELLTSKKSVWVDTMMSEELGVLPEQKNPVKAGLFTYVAFVLAGFVPLLIFVVSIFSPISPATLFPLAMALTFATIFLVGSLRSLVIAKNWLTAGLEMLLIGGLTAVVSYGIGSVLGSLVL